MMEDRVVTPVETNITRLPGGMWGTAFFFLGFVSWGEEVGWEGGRLTWMRNNGPLTLRLKVLSKLASVACSRSTMGIVPAVGGLSVQCGYQKGCCDGDIPLGMTTSILPNLSTAVEIIFSISGILEASA